MEPIEVGSFWKHKISGDPVVVDFEGDFVVVFMYIRSKDLNSIATESFRSRYIEVTDPKELSFLQLELYGG